jgi:SAM-dependent methyltransferase
MEDGAMSEDWARFSEGARPFLGLAEATVDRSGPFLRIEESTIRRVAHKRLAGASLVSIFFKQAASEGRVRLRGVTFRGREQNATRLAYCAMSTADFEGINARQRWANWRVIPRNLDAHAPSRPLRALDLCCGVGHSTEVLVHYLSPGSEVTGLEYNPAFVREAASRTYRDENGQLALVRFVTQSVLEGFRTPEGRAVEDGTVDLVNSSGAVGSHFDREATGILAAEVTRVLAPGGLATIDAGADGTSGNDLVDVFVRHGFGVLSRHRSCLVDRFEQVCFRKRY